MKRMACLLMGLVPVTISAQEEDPFPPKAYPPERYATMMTRSPFVLPSFADDVSVQADWTSDYCIVSVLKIGEESVVMAKKISSGERIPIRAKDNRLGIRLVKLHASSDPHEVSAVIEMGGEEGTIRYDQSILSQVPRSVAPDNPAVIPE